MKRKYIVIGAAVIVLAVGTCCITRLSTSDSSASPDMRVATLNPSPETSSGTESSASSEPENAVETQAVLKSFQDSFSIDLPDGWDIEYQDSVFMATLLYNGEEAGYFNFYTPWTTSTDELVTNILGSHAYAKEDATDTDMGSYIMKKVQVGFSLSDSETENGEKAPADQIHYFYYYPELEDDVDTNNTTIKGTDWVGDLYFDSSLVDEADMNSISSSLQMTCVDE